MPNEVSGLPHPNLIHYPVMDTLTKPEVFRSLAVNANGGALELVATAPNPKEELTNCPDICD